MAKATKHWTEPKCTTRGKLMARPEGDAGRFWPGEPECMPLAVWFGPDGMPTKILRGDEAVAHWECNA